MKIFLLISSFLFAAILAVPPPPPFQDECLVGKEDKYAQLQNQRLPVYQVDMSLPPEDRWTKIVVQYKQQIQNLLDLIFWKLGARRPSIQQTVDENLGAWADMLPYPYGDEIKGISRALNISLGEMVMFNLFYELHSLCTSITAQDMQNQMWHVRNMDFGIFFNFIEKGGDHYWELTELLKANAIVVEYMNGAQSIGIKVFTYAGFVGVFEGQKENKFTISMNTRFDFKVGGIIQVIEWLMGLTPPDMQFNVFLIRDVLTGDNDYNSAYNAFIETPVMTPCYFILGGVKPGDAASIGRTPRGVASMLELGKTTQEFWYLLQTNYDADKPTFYLDDRRTPGHNCMNIMGQANITKSNLFTVLSSKTNLNKQTVITAISMPSTGMFEVYLQNCPDPCWGW